MTVPVQDICQAAAQDLNIIMTGESLSANDGAVVLRALNRIFDRWNATRHAVYTVSQVTYPITPSLQPHTIGPTGTFVVPNRPVSIDWANLILSTTPVTAQPMAVVTDPTAWASLSQPTTVSSMPTAIYYRPDSPNGALYLYPVPDTAYGLELLTRSVFEQVLLTDSVELPAGYYDAVILTLSERIAVPFSRPVPPELALQARQARAAIFANNDVTPPLTTVDAGMPGSDMRGHYDWRTGGWS